MFNIRPAAFDAISSCVGIAESGVSSSVGRVDIQGFQEIADRCFERNGCSWQIESVPAAAIVYVRVDIRILCINIQSILDVCRKRDAHLCNNQSRDLPLDLRKFLQITDDIAGDDMKTRRRIDELRDDGDLVIVNSHAAFEIIRDSQPAANEIGRSVLGQRPRVTA